VADWYGGQNIRANAVDPHQFAHPVGFVRVRPPRPAARPRPAPRDTTPRPGAAAA